MRGWRAFAVVMLVFGLALASGCQAIADKAAQTAVEKATGVKVDKSSGTTTIKTKDGEATVSNSDSAKLPADFPADVPIYENAKIETVMTNDTPNGKAYLVGMKSDDDAAKIQEWFKKTLEDKGWKIVSSMAVGDSVGGVNATKGSLSLNLAVGYGAEKKADISLTVTPKK